MTDTCVIGNFQQGQGATHVVIVIHQGFGNRFADCLQSGKMDNGIDGMLLEHIFQSSFVTDIDFMKRNGFTRDFFNPVKRFT